MHLPILGHVQFVFTIAYSKLSAMHATGEKLSTHLSPADDVFLSVLNVPFVRVYKSNSRYTKGTSDWC